MTSLSRSAIAVLAVLVVCSSLGCRKKPPPTPVVQASANAADAGPELPAAPVVDLLYATNAVVAVSSRVDNPRDLPDHLVDRRPETAWNGRTGDLVGAWIAFRVPSDARVAYLTMSSGFDKRGAKEDLFTANYRVAKVRVSRRGVVVREATLSPDVREPQRIEVGQPGGDFKIEITEAVPGAHAGWREITVSELAVFGTPGAHVRAKPGPPVVRVGSLDLRESPFAVTSAPSYEAACARFVDDDAQAADELRKNAPTGFEEEDADGEAPRGSCQVGRTQPGKGSITETATVAVDDVMKGVYHVHFAGDVLALRSARGVILTNERTGGRETAWPWRVDYRLVGQRWTDDGQLVVDVQEHRVTDSDGYAPPGHEDELHSEVTSILRTVCGGDPISCGTTGEER